MKKLSFYLIFTLCLALNNYAHAQLYNPAKPHPIDTSDQFAVLNSKHLPETDSTTTDTVIQHVNIEGTMFTFTVLRDKYFPDSHARNDYEPLYRGAPQTLIFTRESNGKVVFRFKDGSNEYDMYKLRNSSLSAPDRLYLSIVFFGGGWSYSGELNVVTYSDTGGIKLTHAMHYDDLSFFTFSPTGDTILELMGAYTKGLSMEHNYDDHRYVNYRYTLKDGVYKKELLGKTKYRYPSAGSTSIEELFSEIKKKEPHSLGNVRIKDYILDPQRY